MTQTELYNILKSTGLPVAYNHFKSSHGNSIPDPPYIVYLFTHSSNFGADNKVHHKANNYQVELYSVKKDLASEELLEDLFDENDIFYDKSETYIDSESLYQVIYEILI